MYLRIIQSACRGQPWHYNQYQKHINEIETPYVCTIGNYRVATGGVDKTACFKTIAGELISAAICGNQKRENQNIVEEEVNMAETKKRKWIRENRTENTICGSEVLSAHLRLTKQTQKDQLEEKMNKIKNLTKNIESGKEVMSYIENIKQAELALTRLNVTIENRYWEINDKVVQDKLKIFLKLWFFPLGGGKLSYNKTKQLESLRQFNLTKDRVD